MKRIFMIGDSTMQYNNFQTYPQTGWGQVLGLFAHEDVQIFDYAKNGRSTKSFIDEGRFDKVLSKLEKGDFIICQFGHNDEKIQDPNRYTTPFDTYISNLNYFYEEVTKKGCYFVLATSITRRIFVDGKVVNTHGDYPKAMKEFAEKNNIVCIDLNQITINLYNKLGEEETKRFHMMFDKGIYKNYPDGKNDTSHLTYDGAYMISSLFVDEIHKTNSPLKDLFYRLDEEANIDWAMLID